MILFWGIVGWVLLAPILGIWPLYDTKHSGQGASNNPLFISMPAHTAYNGSGLHWLGVFGEELIEHYGRWVVALIPVIAATFFIHHSDTIISAYAFIFASFLLNLWTVTPLGERLIEYVGKSAFCIIKGVPVSEEAPGLLINYPSFVGMTATQAEVGMRRAYPLAKILVYLLTLRLKLATPK